MKTLHRLILPCIGFLLISHATAQSAYTGEYVGKLFINGNPGGVAIIQIASDGTLSQVEGDLSGTVDAVGLITFDPNDLGFGTSQINADFEFIANGTNNGLNYQLDASLGNGIYAAGTLDDVFTQTNPANLFAGATDLIWDGSRFVALTGQSVAISNDGKSWETRSIGLNAAFTRIAHGNGTYVLVGESDAIATSADLQTFTQRSSGLGLPAFNFADIAFYNNRFFAANIDNAYISSPDGVAWTEETSPFAASLVGGIGRMRVLDGELFIGWQKAGNFANTVYYSSAEGFNFTGPSAAVNIGHETLALAFGNGVYLAASTGGIARSTDGQSFSKVTGLPATTARGLAFLNGRFVANFLNDRWYHSTDGLAWTAATGEETEAVALATDGSIAVGVGDEPFYSEDDGANWFSAVADQMPTPFFASDFQVVGGNSRFLFTQPSSPSYLSTDGTQFTDTGQQLTNVAYGNGLFFGYDEMDSRLEYSVDGIDWFPVTIPATAAGSLDVPGGVVFSGGAFVRGGWHSADGIDWSQDASYSPPSFPGGTPDLNQRLAGAVASPANGDIFLPGSIGGSFWFSSDGGVTYESRSFGLLSYGDAAYGNGIWVLVSSSGHYRTGTSLASTTARRYQDGVETPDFYSIDFIDGIFYASIEDNRVLISTDGENWTQKTYGANVRLVDGAFNDGIGILTGRQATVLVTETGNTSPSAPAITFAGNPVNANEGDSVTLSATATNAVGANVRWLLDGVALTDGLDVQGAATDTLTLPAIRPEQAGNYRLLVTTATGGAISEQAAEVTVNPLPVFTQQPESSTVFSGQSLTLTAAVDDATATLQWRKNGTDLPGETGPTLVLDDISAADAAIYTLVATNAVGSRASDPAAVSVNVLSGGGLSPDATFMGNVPALFAGGSVNGIGLQPDGKLIVGAKYDDGSGFGPHLHRLNSDGTLDASFDPPDFSNGQIQAIVADDQGRIFTGGTHSGPMALSVLDSDGTEIKQFSTSGPRFSIHDLIIDGNHLYVIGDFVLFDGEPAAGVTRVNLTDLTTDADYQANADDMIDGLFFDGELQSDGRLVVMGQTTLRTFVRLGTDGTPDNSFPSPWLSNFPFFAVDGQDSLHVGRSKYTADGVEIDAFLNDGWTLSYLGDDVLLSYTDRPIAVSALAGGAVAEPDFGDDPAGPTFSRIYDEVLQTGDDFIFAGKFDSFMGVDTHHIAYLTAAGAADDPVQITRQPQSIDVRPGERAVLAASATGNGLSYQWEKQGTPLAAETGTALVIETVTAGDAGQYRLVVTDGEGHTATSDSVTLNVLNPAGGETFAQWALANLPGESPAFDADANGNGVADGLDFVFDLQDGDLSGLPEAVLLSDTELGLPADGKHYLTLTVRHRTGLQGIALAPVASTDLADLASGTDQVVIYEETTENGFKTTRYRTTFAVEDTARGFMAVGAELTVSP